MPEKASSNDWTCPPKEHDFIEMWRWAPGDGREPEPARIFCKRCGWVREVPLIWEKPAA